MMHEGLYRFFWSRRLNCYLASKPRVRARLGFETDHPRDSQHGIWLYYDNWPSAWKARLVDFCLAYEQDKPLPMPDPLPLADPVLMDDSSRLGYRDVEVARDTYLTQVAHALWLDMTEQVPWRLEDWSDNELSYLLSSHVCFSAYRTFPGNDLYYVVIIGSRSETTENILGDPRAARQFLQCEPEQGRCLVGATPSETGARLSGWFHDYLWHNPTNLDGYAFHYGLPMLSDRLRRHEVVFGDVSRNVYVTTAGCGSASSLFADLMRSANIPVRKVTNIAESPTGAPDQHIGLVFDWQGGKGTARYLLHTDDLYNLSYVKDPAPPPKDTERGVALWEHVWLDPTRFGELFSSDSETGVFGRATFAQCEKYWEMGSWLVSSAKAVQASRGAGQDEVVASFQQQGFSQSEAEECWKSVEASVLAYGDGDMAVGYQRLLDGPESRHGQWCSRTGKCL